MRQRFALTEDILVINTQDDAFQIRRRDADGQYLLTKNINITGATPITNGKYFGAISTSGSLSIGQLVNDQLLNPVTFNDYVVQAAKIYDDDTLVIFDRSSSSLITFNLNSTSKLQETLVPGQAFGWTNPFGTETYYPTTSFQGDFFFALNTTADDLGYFFILQRQPDLSWGLMDVFRPEGFIGYLGGIAAHNGYDILALANYAKPEDATHAVGEFSIFKKNAESGEWTLQQVVTPLSIGYVPNTALGVDMAFIDPNTLIVAAPLENSNNYGQRTGRIGIFSRNVTTEMWELTMEFISTAKEGYFGMGFGLNSKDLVTFGYSSDDNNGRLYVVPRCQFEPFNVTCLTVHLDNCTEIPLDDLYSFDTRCRSRLSTDVIGAGSINEEISFKFSFTQFGMTSTCTSSVHCPVPQIPNAPSSNPPLTHIPLPSPPNKVSTASAMTVIWFLYLAVILL